LSGEGDVGAWVLLCRPKAGTIVPMQSFSPELNPPAPDHFSGRSAI